MNTLTYKGYTARIDFDDRDNSLVGRLLGIQDIIGFHAENVADLHTAFEEAVDDYLEACEKIGKSPEKPASGKLLLRVPPELHAAALIKAQAGGKSLNQLAIEALSREVRME
ncbi:MULTISPECIES: type II toxin-antitoxin system HicB family antitoxin [Acidithiobacillus]|jgi:predicted HicB family RNase H-like nuclease|uniref:Antitoxin HicB n=1 Tax=Acidithiobacillus thiooxidans TaxID=930 RepID=A0A1C2JHS1_ACITH|nr:type II toxin-antitoxin system HicB family antitoxin [Acidithiobacillus thiooxidans]OCX74320.1 antitoxin HicB [Acidithiobacillus thiooxidans]OCX75454.1 antitoxin HicB [Acidithiobacillus thiooxidans]OCX78397.1 antitoxin HicB [Acidithiobacillus thiooxidans]OCX83226.1 antitoxin HicB [Acidithiobacillus thiooxidans]OCX83659.1 antitoxin HicB [Acidithiobacillus thiooxidans]